MRFEGGFDGNLAKPMPEPSEIERVEEFDVDDAKWLAAYELNQHKSGFDPSREDMEKFRRLDAQRKINMEQSFNESERDEYQLLTLKQLEGTLTDTERRRLVDELQPRADRGAMQF